MGYTITIGEAVVRDIEWDDYTPGEFIRPYLEAREEAHDTAPVFPNDGLTGNTNSRSPSYTGWSDFAREVGLYELFFGTQEGSRTITSGLMTEHPGCALLGEEHALIVRQALERYRLRKPDAQPGFEPWSFPGEEPKGDPVPANCDGQLARLIWLDYWVTWAVENCTHPIMENT